jgi:hypothetical protein
MSFIYIYVTGYGLDSHLFSIISRPAPELSQPPIQWVPGAISLGVKRLWSETDHSPPSSAEVKNGGANLHSPISLHGIVLH